MLRSFRRWPVTFALLLVLSLATWGCAAGGPAYPTKPVTLIIPFEAGGGPDGTFRMLAQEAEKELGQKIVVVNRTGGTGSVGVAEVIQSKPDGYTVGMCAVAVANIQPLLRDVPYKGPDDMLPLVQATEAPMLLYVKADSPFKTLKDLVDEAKKRPGKVTVSIAGGLYNLPHADVVLFERAAGIKLTAVPYGSAEHLPAVLGGTVEASTGQVAMMTQHIKAGTVRSLGVFSEARAKTLPDVPTFKEQGYDVSLTPYEFVIAPKGLPDAVKDKLVAAFTKAVKSQAFQEYAEKSGIVLAYLGPDDLAKRLKGDAEKYRELVQSAGWKKQ